MEVLETGKEVASKVDDNDDNYAPGRGKMPVKWQEVHVVPTYKYMEERS